MGETVGMAFVYIEEAHAENEWPIATPEEFAVSEQHTTLESRLASAAQLQATLPVLDAFPMYADSMDRTFQTLYGAWPTRMYVHVSDPDLVVTPPCLAHIVHHGLIVGGWMDGWIPFLKGLLSFYYFLLFSIRYYFNGGELIHKADAVDVRFRNTLVSTCLQAVSPRKNCYNLSRVESASAS